jgi:RNA polymerase sigma-70 factor (ECF subfamily)
MVQRYPSPSSAADNLESANGQAVVDLAALVVAHHAAMYRYAYRLCGCPAEAEDLTQQAFLIAQRKLHQLREAERAGAWLFAVLRSCFLKSVRRQRPVAAAVVNLEVDEVAGESPVVEEFDREALTVALNELPSDFRSVLLMFYFEELSYQEIAQQLEIPIGTVMSRLSRAKGRLRTRLAGKEALSTPAATKTNSVRADGAAKMPLGARQ